MNLKQITAVLLTAELLAGCQSTVNAELTEITDNPDEPKVNLPAAVYEDSFDNHAGTITFDGENASIQGAGLSAASADVTISAPGTYVISGNSEEASITVNCKRSGTVHLVLNNADLSSSTEPLISIEQADQTIITGYQGTDNTLTSSNTDAILSKDNLLINGSGTMNIKAQGDAIHANDDLVIADAIMSLDGDDALDVNDTLKIVDSILSMKAQKDGIHAGDDEKEESGNIIISSGMISVTAGDDGIDAAGNLITEGNAALTNTSDMGSEGTEKNSAASEETKSKGISLKGSADLYSGTYKIDSQNDAINSSSKITVYDGIYEIMAGDDGMHADNMLTIQKGTLAITSYEGLESAEIIINEGTIEIHATDDGINAASGTSSAGMMESDGSRLEIHGGEITIDADGDGVDSNGDIIMEDGTVTIYGPQDNGNGALDYNVSFTASGGTIHAGGSSGMLQSISEDSTLHAIIIGITDDSGTIEIKDADGKTIASYTSAKSYDSLVFASENLKEGKSYTVTQNCTELGTITISDTNNDLNYDAGRGRQNDFQGRGQMPPQGRTQDQSNSDERLS